MKATPKPKKKQLRGAALKNRIAEVVREYAEEQEGRLDMSRVSMKAIAARVPCSRTTLLKYDAIVSGILEGLGLQLARRTGEVHVRILDEQIELLRQEKAELKAELDSLRAHHAHLYERFLMVSAPMSALIRDYAAAASHDQGRCLLCGGSPPPASPHNVVDLQGKPRSALTTSSKKDR